MEFTSQPENTAEKFPIDRAQVLAVLKEKGREDPAARELLSTYIEQRRLEVEKITEKKEHYRASIVCSIENAELFAEAGYVEISLDDLEESYDMAYAAYEDGLCERISVLVEQFKKTK